MQRPGLRYPLAFACAALVHGACASGPVRVNHDERTVQAQTPDRRLSYRFGPIAPSWEPLTIEGNDVAWRDRAIDGVVHANHSCERAQDVPLASLAQHLLIGFTQREVTREETIPFDGREALHQVVNARLDGVPIVMDLYVLKKDGCVYDLGYVAPPQHFAQGEPAFDAFARGFHTIATGGPTGREDEAR